MTKFVSGGHNTGGIRPDPGAVNKSLGITEAEKAAEFRDLVVTESKKFGTKIITDRDDETLAQYLKRIKTGNGSVVIEFHFDSFNEKSTGCTGLIEEDADRLDRAFADELTKATALILGIKNRGVKTEKESFRGRLGLMREEGIICLLELGFLSNPKDMAKYEAHKECLARVIAQIIDKYEQIL